MQNDARRVVATRLITTTSAYIARRLLSIER
jgi:hypothetical protein